MVASASIYNFTQIRPDHTIPSSLWCDNSYYLYLLGIILTLLAIIFITQILLFLVVYIKRKKRVRSIYRAFDRIEKSYMKHNQATVCISDCNLLLKKIIEKTLKIKTTNLHGHFWLQTLNRLGSTNQFTQKPGCILGVYYNPKNLSAFNLTELMPVVKKWVNTVIGYD